MTILMICELRFSTYAKWQRLKVILYVDLPIRNLFKYLLYCTYYWPITTNEWKTNGEAFAQL